MGNKQRLFLYVIVFHFILDVWALCLSITIQIKSVLTPSKFTIETLLLIAFEIKIYIQSSGLRSFILHSKNSIQLYIYICIILEHCLFWISVFYCQSSRLETQCCLVNRLHGKKKKNCCFVAKMCFVAGKIITFTCLGVGFSF